MADDRIGGQHVGRADARDVVAPTHLPPGWRSAEEEDWGDPYAAARRRSRILWALAATLIVALVIGFLVWSAAGRYARGVEALNDQAYSTAIIEFSMAKVLVFPYRDARSLEEQARRALEAEMASFEQEKTRTDTVVSQLDAAATRLDAGSASGVLAALRAIPGGELRTALGRSDAARAAADSLAAGLEAAARAALKGARWERAGRFAAALLVLEPSSEAALSLSDRAKTGEDLRAKLGEARDAARRGQWRRALRLALAVAAVRKDFPGAASLIADARAALKPKPKPSPTPTAATTAPTSAPTPTATTPPPPPPP